MRIVALEEHFAQPDILTTHLDPAAVVASGWMPADRQPPALRNALGELGDARIAAMDAAGIDVQVLSYAGPGAELATPTQGPALARAINDMLHGAVRRHPDRLASFAHLPTTAPEAAAIELERAVNELGFVGALINGTTGGRFLDAPEFAPILDAAERLDVPLYLHPAPPPASVRQAYYQNLPGLTGQVLATAGFGWHAETALHVLRLVASGALEERPRLKLIIGHMGEGLPMMLARLDDVLSPAAAHLKRSVAQTILDQVWITTSGFFSLPPFLAALTSFGVERILFSVDYPFSSNSRGTAFLHGLPVAPDELAKIAHGTADRLLGLGAR